MEVPSPTRVHQALRAVARILEDDCAKLRPPLEPPGLLVMPLLRGHRPSQADKTAIAQVRLLSLVIIPQDITQNTLNTTIAGQGDVLESTLGVIHFGSLSLVCLGGVIAT